MLDVRILSTRGHTRTHAHTFRIVRFSCLSFFLFIATRFLIGLMWEQPNVASSTLVLSTSWAQARFVDVLLFFFSFFFTVVPLQFNLSSSYFGYLLLLDSGRAIAVRIEHQRTRRGGSLSVDPGHGDPLRRRVHSLDGVFQVRDRLLDVIVDDGEVEQVAVRLLQHVRFLGQFLQAAVVLEKELAVNSLPRLTFIAWAFIYLSRTTFCLSGSSIVCENVSQHTRALLRKSF